MSEVYTPVPVDDAAAIANRRHKDVVVIISIDRRHDLMHTTSFGKTADEKPVAAELADQLMTAIGCDLSQKRNFEDFRDQREAAQTAENLRRLRTLRPESEWCEEYGPVIWWRVPISEPPFVGTPLDDEWIDDYYTHWTPLPSPIPCEVGA